MTGIDLLSPWFGKWTRRRMLLVQSKFFVVVVKLLYNELVYLKCYYALPPSLPPDLLIGRGEWDKCSNVFFLSISLNNFIFNLLDQVHLMVKFLNLGLLKISLVSVFYRVGPDIRYGRISGRISGHF